MNAWSPLSASALYATTVIAAASMTRGTVAAAVAIAGLPRFPLAAPSRPHTGLTRPISAFALLPTQRTCSIIATAQPAYRSSPYYYYVSTTRLFGLSLSLSSSSTLTSQALWHKLQAQAFTHLAQSRYRFSTSAQTQIGPSASRNARPPNEQESANQETPDVEDRESSSGSKPRMVTTSKPPHFDPIPYGFVPPEPKVYTTSTIHAPGSPTTSAASSEPKLKVIYSSAAEKAARAPPPLPPKGSWQHYRNKIFDLSGGDVREINIRSYMRWQFISATKIFGWMLIFSFFLGMLGYGTMNAYIELQEPTPSVFPEMIRVTMRWIYFHTEVNRDLPLAGLRGRVLMTELEDDMNSKGGWDKCSVEWKRAYIDTCFRVANLFMALGKEDDAYIIYRRILAVETDIVDAKRRSEANLKMGQCAINLNKVDEGVQLLQAAVQDAVSMIPESTRPNINPKKPVLPEPEKQQSTLPSELLQAAQALAIQYSRLSRPEESLPIFLSLLRTIQSLPEDRRDSCREASVMAYLGEVIWTLGKQEEGLAWTKKALMESEKGAGERNTCRDCANYAVGNAITMTKELGTRARGIKTKEDVQNEVNALRSRENQLGRFGIQRKD